MIRRSTLTKHIAPLKRGDITADGTEQALLEFEGVGKISGHVNMENTTDGDVVVIRQYIKVKDGGAYVKYAEETYSGTQALPLVHITPKAVDVALKVTLQQTAGAFKTFEYSFVGEP